jgi:hypothetical protein
MAFAFCRGMMTYWLRLVFAMGELFDGSLTWLSSAGGALVLPAFVTSSERSGIGGGCKWFRSTPDANGQA